MKNQVTIEQGAQNFIDRDGSKRAALAHARKNLAAYKTGFMSNASDRDDSIAWYERVIKRLSK